MCESQRFSERVIGVDVCESLVMGLHAVECATEENRAQCTSPPQLLRQEIGASASRMQAQFRKGGAGLAFGPAIVMSHANARFNPAPIA